jgi:hypothetical protein
MLGLKRKMRLHAEIKIRMIGVVLRGRGARCGDTRMKENIHDLAWLWLTWRLGCI